MVGTIIKHEWRILVTERLLWVILPVYTLLIAYGIANGVAWVSFQEQTIVEATGQARSNLRDLQTWADEIDRGLIHKGVYEDPRNAGLVSRGMAYEYAVLPPGPLAPLAIGQSDLYPYYVRITRQTLADLVNTDEIENPTNLAAGRFDLGFVFIYLYPLLILALSYNILSLEREQGTQSILLSQPVSLRRFVLGKILLRGIVVLAITVTLSIAAFVLSGAPISSWTAIWRLLLWIVVVMAYGSFWFGLAIAVNALGKRSATNALALMGAWLFFVVLLPAMLNISTKVAYPVPSRIELVQAKRAAEDQANRSNALLVTRALEDGAEMGPADENESTQEALNQYYRDLLAVERSAELATQPVVQRFENQIAAQQRLAKHFRYLSPAILAQVAISDIAGTGTARYRRFDDAVRAYHRRWRQFFDPRIVAGSRLTAADYDRIPHFEHVDERDEDVLQRLLGELVPLFMLGAIASAAGFLLLRRYPIVEQ